MFFVLFLFCCFLILCCWSITNVLYPTYLIIFVGSQNTEFIHKWYTTTDRLGIKQNTLESHNRSCSIPSFTISGWNVSPETSPNDSITAKNVVLSSIDADDAAASPIRACSIEWIGLLLSLDATIWKYKSGTFLEEQFSYFFDEKHDIDHSLARIV